MNTPLESLTIGPPRAEDRAWVIDLLVNQRPTGERDAYRAELERQFGDGSFPDEGLFVARRDTSLVGVAWGQVLPGHCAVFWPPSLVTGEPESTAELLGTRVLQHLRSREIAVAQALLETNRGILADRLRRAGFRFITDLLYLVSDHDHFPNEQPPTPLCFEPWDERQHPRQMADLIEASYRQTLDCPQMNGLRDINDVLTGYRAIGRSQARLWFVVRNAGRDVGCLLLADHPDQNQWELVYMGLRPESRGKQWGIDIVRFAQWQAYRAGRTRLVLAVDANNHPAKRMYAEAGFSAWDRRAVFIRSFR